MSGIPSEGSRDPKPTPSKVWGDGVGVKTLEPSVAIQRGPSASWGTWKGFGSKPHLPSLSRPARLCAGPGRFYPQTPGHR